MCNSHTVTFTLVNYTIQWLLVYLYNCGQHHCLISEHSHHPERNPITVSSHSLLRAPLANTDLVCLSNRLFWLSHLEIR